MPLLLRVHGMKQGNFVFVSTFVSRGGVVVMAPRHKPAGREFDPQWRHWNFSVT
jgi:hypothetical protein